MPLFWCIVYVTWTGPFFNMVTEAPIRKILLVSKQKIMVKSHWLVLELWWKSCTFSKLVFTRKIIFRWFKEYSYHFVFFPSPLKINTAIFTSLNNCPPASTRFHLTVSLQREHTVTAWEMSGLGSSSYITETRWTEILRIRPEPMGFSGVNLCGLPRGKGF